MNWTTRARSGACALALTLALMLGSGACVHGSNASAEVRQAVVEAELVALQGCWDELAGEHPGVSGSLLFAVSLRRNGTVEWVEIEVDELRVVKLDACAVRQIKKWRFPADRRRRTIRFGVGFTAPG